MKRSSRRRAGGYTQRTLCWPPRELSGDSWHPPFVPFYRFEDGIDVRVGAVWKQVLFGPDEGFGHGVVLLSQVYREFIPGVPFLFIHSGLLHKPRCHGGVVIIGRLDCFNELFFDEAE